jgi:L-glutamine:2-deoxy-scyllo-inosose/3-amino-2,3-dideoxy-scyllo-inosose aminotransferase
MSDNLPAVLGGVPVREPGFRRTPEVGIDEALFVAEQIGGRDWEPDAKVGGRPVAKGLTLPANVADALGVEQAALAAEFAAVQAPGQRVHVVPADNGTHVIRMAMAALSVHASRLGLRQPEVGSEVIVPAATWQATACAPVRRNLVSVLVDVLPGTLCIDPAAVEAAITDRTVAIVPVHLYGRMADLDSLLALGRRHGLAVVEDCAHAHGAVRKGRGAGTIGLMGTFSLQGSKSLSSQEGGLVTTADDQLADQVISLVTCGRQVGSSVTLQGDNDRMAGAIAALARAQLLRFPKQNAQRVATARELDRTVGRLPGIRPLDPQPEVDVPPTYKWVFRVDLREYSGMSLDQLRVALEGDLGCEFAPIYTPLTDSPVHQPLSDPAHRIDEEFWKRLDPSQYAAPNAWDAYKTVLAAEHAALLDRDFPARFAEAVTRIHAHAARIAREVQV